MSKKVLLLGLFLCLFLLTGCDSSDNTVVSNGTKVNTSKMIHEHCVREGTIENGEVSLNYDIYYKGEELNLLVSEETVISSSDEVLNTYEEAYKNLHQYYKNLEYFDAEVVRGDTTVTSKMTINYAKIDINKLLEIEGSDDNIIENGKAKVELWKTLAKKVGTSCQAVEN